MRHQAIIGVLITSLLTGTTLGQSTRPAGERMQRFGQRIQELISQLDLTEDQQQKIDDIVKDAKQQFQQALPSMRQMTPEERRGKVQEILQGVREEIGDLLTPKQKQKLQELIKKRQADNPGAKENAEQAERRQAVSEHSDLSVKVARPAAAEPIAPPSKPALATGEAAPDGSLHWMSGDAFHLSTFKGKVIILVFGSYSTPAFRDKAGALPKIAEAYEGRAKFILVYTKEAHPTDGWAVERNKQDDVEIAQPTTLAGRRAAAQQAITALHLNNIPVALDTMDDTATTAFGAFPDGVVIIGKDGKIVARQHWLEPTALPAIIDQQLKP